MSIENAHAFLKESQQNATIRHQLAGLKGIGTLKRLTEIAATAGFFFTEDEYRAAIVELAEGELSEESLNEVIEELRGERGEI